MTSESRATVIGTRAATDAATGVDDFVESFWPILDDCTDGICLVDAETLLPLRMNSALIDWIAHQGRGTPDSRLVEWLPELNTHDLLSTLELVQSGERNAMSASVIAPTDQRCERPVSVVVRRIPHDKHRTLAVIIRPSDSVSSFGAVDRVDPLTGVADRSQLIRHLNELLDGDRRTDQRFVVLFIDVDGFKQVNDRFGHLVGDQVLRSVAKRLTACVRPDDLVARYGGDEFVVVAKGVGDCQDAVPIVQRMFDVFERPIEFVEGRATLSMSIGVAEATGDSTTAESILRAADAAMYASKRHVRCRADG